MLKEKVEEYFKKDAEIRKVISSFPLGYPHDQLNRRMDTQRKILKEIVDWAEKIEDLKVFRKER